ncbi:RNA-binding protein musashi, putative [Ixodes scapularis]|uniref:RNA-binding protein musashi, putative n=1 Tax=Ixodes scapularis TaxID=6945 RepID=B7PE09_IXOSC|nr:RNA-binding protein musashi, putative [Ixodes scapularis]|eukprot:XP_002399587.1 RNA-binding protein musashi, putative [Ixodes scapularis]
MASTEKYTIDCKKDEKIILPTAPKAARGPDVDMSKVPSKPPYTVYLGNLPYDVSDEDVIKFFRTLKVSSVRLPRESGERGRMRGFGYAEFPDRGTLLEALAYNNEANNEGRERGNRDMGRSERATDGDWRSMTRDDGDDGGRPDHSYGSSRGFDDSDGGYRRSGFGRDSDRDGGDRDRSFGGGFSRDRPRGFGDRDQGYDRDRGFERRSGGGGGYERPRDYDRGYGGGSSGGSRDYGSSYRDDRDSRDRYRSDDHPSERDQDSGPRERKKLQLKPRSVPVEAPAKEAAAAAAPAAPAPAKASAAIFGGARPVDTAAREREIEERLAKQREEEERKQIMSREPFVDSRKDERVRRSSVGSGSGRSRRSSESGGRDSYDEGARQPVSRQYSNVEHPSKVLRLVDLEEPRLPRVAGEEPLLVWALVHYVGTGDRRPCRQ